MDREVKYQGRIATPEDIEYIRKLIAENPQDSRYRLSKKLCRAWNWVQPNGVLRDMVCRGYLLRLEEAGSIQLPPRRHTPPNPLVNRRRPPQVEVDQTPLHATLSEIQPLEIRQVRHTPLEKVCNSLIEQYHYLGYCHPVGEHLKYIVFTQGRPIACFTWSSAPLHLGARDRYIGWSAAVRKKNLHLIAYQSRYLILPWVQVPMAASFLLGRIVKVLPRDWQSLYHHPLYFLETFVDSEKFKGTCYQAANWLFLGYTTGRGKHAKSKRPNRSLKAVWGYPLSKDFREALQRE
jgi:Druantia protein DruA